MTTVLVDLTESSKFCIDVVVDRGLFTSSIFSKALYVSTRNRQNIQAKVTIHSFQNCEKDKEYPLSVDLKITHDGDKNIIEQGVITNKIDFTKDIKALIEVFHEDGGQWKELIKKEDSLCNMRESFIGEFAEEVEKAAGITDACLAKKGVYKLSNFVADFSKVKYKDFLEGKSKVRTTMHNGADTVACLEVEFTIEK
nr:unnamed protein product [Callosobruchus analis]